MSGQVEALAEVIAGIDGGRLADASARAHDACLRAARAVLASDWLRDHDRALRESIVADIELNCSHFMAFYRGSPGACGYCETAAAVARGEQP